MGFLAQAVGSFVGFKAGGSMVRALEDAAEKAGGRWCPDPRGEAVLRYWAGDHWTNTTLNSGPRVEAYLAAKARDERA